MTNHRKAKYGLIAAIVVLPLSCIPVFALALVARFDGKMAGQALAIVLGYGSGLVFAVQLDIARRVAGLRSFCRTPWLAMALGQPIVLVGSVLFTFLLHAGLRGFKVHVQDFVTIWGIALGALVLVAAVARLQCGKWSKSGLLWMILTSVAWAFFFDDIEGHRWFARVSEAFSIGVWQTLFAFSFAWWVWPIQTARNTVGVAAQSAGAPTVNPDSLVLPPRISLKSLLSIFLFVLFVVGMFVRFSSAIAYRRPFTVIALVRVQGDSNLVDIDGDARPSRELHLRVNTPSAGYLAIVATGGPYGSGISVYYPNGYYPNGPVAVAVKRGVAIDLSPPIVGDDALPHEEVWGFLCSEPVKISDMVDYLNGPRSSRDQEELPCDTERVAFQKCGPSDCPRQHDSGELPERARD